MKIYQACRVAPGVSTIFSHKIIIGQNSVTISEPGIFSYKEETIPFSQIASINIESPLIGFSAIRIETTGNNTFYSRGYTKTQVKEIKEIISQNINNVR